MAHRGLNPQTCDVHCGFDGGQSMLKLAVTITDRLEGEKSGRSHYSDVSSYISTVIEESFLSKTPPLEIDAKTEKPKPFCKGF